MASPIRRTYSFDSLSTSPTNSELSDTDLKVCKFSKMCFGFSPLDSSPRRLSSSDRINLDDLALSPMTGVGYKAANMVQLERLAKQMGVSIPPFKALSHGVILEHIEKTYPEFLKDYAEFVDILRGNGSLTEDAKALLSKIRGGVEASFSGRNIYASPELAAWVASRASSHLIVRSTGKEDSDNISNAGGNLSIPFTKKELVSISENVGKVVASYFSEKSIAQRLASKDETLLSESVPFVPVLIQEEIKEEDGCELSMVPRSGVMFVSDQFSEASIGLGHNEGIVSSVVDTDTIRFSPEGEVRMSVSRKTSRLKMEMGEDGNVEAVKVDSSPKLASDPSISEDVAKRLKHIANYLYAFYEKKLDIEFTIVGNQIYILQVRPLKIPTLKDDPSYLEAVEDSVKGYSITDGGCYVRKIEYPNQIIVAHSISEAYATYTDLSLGEQEDILGIVVAQKAPRTSHEAVFFIGQGLPVMQVGDTDIDIPFYMDPQQAILAKSGDVKSGYSSYPMPLAYSMQESDLVKAMHMQFFEKSASRGDFIRRELSHLKAKVGEFEEVKIESVEDLRVRVEVIKKGDLLEANQALKEIHQFIFSQIQRKDLNAHARIELILILENLINIGEKDPISITPMSLERLFTAKLIEACLFQDGEKIIGGLSLVRTLTDLRNKRIINEELKKVDAVEGAVDIAFIKTKLSILNDGLKEKFGYVLNSLQYMDEEEKSQLIVFLNKLADQPGGLEVVNVLISKLIAKYPRGQELELLNELLETTKDLEIVFKEVSKLNAFITDERRNMDLWRNPEYVQTHKAEIQRKLQEIGFREDSDLKKIFDASSDEGQLILIQNIKNVVDTYDEIIKTFKISDQYPSAKSQMLDFFELLRPYRQMTKFVRSLSSKTLSDIDSNYLFPINLYALSEREAKVMLQAKANFNVSELLQDDVEYTGEEPVGATTLEEKFTLFHQTMLKDLSKLEVARGLNLSLLPEKLHEFIEGVLSGELASGKNLKSIRVERDHIIVDFSIPLRQHGAALSFNYDRKTKKATIEQGLYGGNENNRWGIIKNLALYLSDICELKVKSISARDTSLLIQFYQTQLSHSLAKQGSSFLTALLDATFTLSGFGMEKEGDACMLEIVPHEFLTAELVEDELSRNPAAIQYVPEDQQTESLVQNLIKKDGLILEHLAPVWRNNPKMANLAVEQNPSALQFVDERFRTEELCLKACLKKRSALSFVPTRIRHVINRLLQEALEAPKPEIKPKRRGLQISDD